MANEIVRPTIDQLAQYIDHTLLKPEATKLQIRTLCEEALRHQFFGVCVNSSMVSTCYELLKNSKVKIISVVGFPLGACEISLKPIEAVRAIDLGADEVDMVINIGALKAGDNQYVENEIQSVVRAAVGKIVKVILETALLSQEEKIRACEISVQAGAHFVKTSTGFGGGGATLEDVRLMKKAVGTNSFVKASGGIKNFEMAADLIAAGATRLGTSSGVALIAGNKTNTGY